MKLLSTKYKRLLTLAVIPLIALNLADPRRVSGDETSNFGDPEQILNYHLMHPGGDSAPGDPNVAFYLDGVYHCLLYTSPSPRDLSTSRMPSSA